MTEKEWLALREGDILVNLHQLRPTVGPMIPAGTKFMVSKVENPLVVQTLDEARMPCVFMKNWALQLLQKYENPRA